MHLFSPRHSSCKHGSALGLSKKFDYMPYGTLHSVATAPIAEADYKYTGKEQQTAFGLDNLYDSQARFQYVTDGSFLSHDDLAEQFQWLSPYNYCAGNPINKVDPDGRLIDDYFNYDGKYLGSDNASTDFVRIIPQETWDTFTNLDGIGATDLQNASVLFSKARMSDESVLKVYDHYNMTGEEIGILRDKSAVMDTHMRYAFNRATRKAVGIPTIQINVNINYRKSSMHNNSNNIINIFEHEYDHAFKARKSLQTYINTPKSIRELSAIISQISTDTFAKTTKQHKLIVLRYAIKNIFKIIPDGLVSISHSINRFVCPKD